MPRAVRACLGQGGWLYGRTSSVPQESRNGRLGHRRLQHIPTILALSTGVQGAVFAVAHGPSLNLVVVGITVTFFAASLTHAAIWRRRLGLALLVIVTVGSGCVEYLGMQYELPFGAYRYQDQIGWTVLGVPLLVPMAWTMMAYPAIVVARRITVHPALGPLTAGIALGAWDLFVDPLMVREGYWVWTAGGPSWAGIPISNYLGWLGVGTGLLALLWRFFPAPDRLIEIDDRVPYSLYAGAGLLLLLKTIVCQMPAAAIGGTLGMGSVVGIAWFRAGQRANWISHRWPFVKSRVLRRDVARAGQHQLRWYV